MRLHPRHVLLAVLVFAPALKAQVAHPGIGVRVWAPGVLFERFNGVYLGRAGGDTLLFGNDERGPVRVPASAITRLEVSKGRSHWRGALHGALWGAGVGLGIGVLGLALDTTSGSDAEALSWLAIGGAELGAIIGAVVGKTGWVGAQPTVLTSAAFDRRRIGVRFALRTN